MTMHKDAVIKDSEIDYSNIDLVESALRRAFEIADNYDDEELIGCALLKYLRQKVKDKTGMTDLEIDEEVNNLAPIDTELVNA